MPHTNRLGTTPKEIRLQIFEHAIGDEWQGQMPTIIKALRSDKDGELYNEALVAFRKKNYSYIFSIRNDFGFKDMPMSLIASIGKITIECTYVLSSIPP
jgi:hypothetical protein